MFVQINFVYVSNLEIKSYNKLGNNRRCTHTGYIVIY